MTKSACTWNTEQTICTSRTWKSKFKTNATDIDKLCYLFQSKVELPRRRGRPSASSQRQVGFLDVICALKSEKCHSWCLSTISPSLCPTTLLLYSNRSHVNWAGGGWVVSSSPQLSLFAFPPQPVGGRKYLQRTHHTAHPPFTHSLSTWSEANLC